MRCGCPVCGGYAVQVERGFESRCVCPGCGWECSDCMGGKNKKFTFISKDNLGELEKIEFEHDKSDEYDSYDDESAYDFEED